MNEYHFDVDLTRTGRRVSAAWDEADRMVWNSARDVLSERAYRTASGTVRVRFEWPRWSDAPSMRAALQVIDDGGTLDPLDAPSYVELFFHDVFLLFNLAVPGSFGGVIAPAGPMRVDEIALDARVFEYATGAREESAPLRALPLRNVVRWYDALDLRTRQVATYGMAKVLFHLLNLSRGAENLALSILALAQSLELLGAASRVDGSVFRLRDAIANGSAPVLHPLHDEVLDPQAEEIAAEWIDAADAAAGAVIAALQAHVGVR